ncbi:MAG: hypothetical protein QOD97_2105 [Mycobacterium sp.]|nr:hypothetical protein [Mycobacterium sp.]
MRVQSQAPSLRRLAIRICRYPRTLKAGPRASIARAELMDLASGRRTTTYSSGPRPKAGPWCPAITATKSIPAMRSRRRLDPLPTVAAADQPRRTCSGHPFTTGGTNGSPRSAEPTYAVRQSPQTRARSASQTRLRGAPRHRHRSQSTCLHHIALRWTASLSTRHPRSKSSPTSGNPVKPDPRASRPPPREPAVRGTPPRAGGCRSCRCRRTSATGCAKGRPAPRRSPARRTP